MIFDWKASQGEPFGKHHVFSIFQLGVGKRPINSVRPFELAPPPPHPPLPNALLVAPHVEPEAETPL